MKVSMEWLRQLVDVDQNAEELAETLTRGGIEVENVENLSKGFEKVVIGEISSLTKHPDADRLWVCDVNVGEGKVTIVTGAQNLQEGDKIPVAMIGAVLPNDLSIRKSKLRGVVSEGMLCSREELLLDNSVGLARSEGGILVLPPDAPLGENFGKYLGREDSVLDLELYPNRPDCLAMVNVAREVASLTGKQPHLPKWADKTKGLDLPAAGDFQIIIEEEDLCWRYAALVVEDVHIGPSPEWMQRRLKAAGVRPISNIVDITNYCMLEMGQPLHAFDRDKIKGNIHVRTAKAGEKLVTLDGVERSLQTDTLLIADDREALGVAGVMGGFDSEITQETKRLLIESAHFSGVSVRRTSRRLGLRSEASNRFEKGVNPYGCVATLGRVCELLIELGAGRPVALLDELKTLPPRRQISLSVEHTATVLGLELKNSDVRQVLENLNFKFEEKENLFNVEIPTYRADLEIEEDLMEEVARLRGYDLIPTTLPQGDTTQGRRTAEQEFRRRLRRVLVQSGMDEVMTYTFTGAARDAQWGSAQHSIPLLNPLREELSVMRTSLVPGLLEVAAKNVARRNTVVSIFEVGMTYWGEEKPLRRLPREVLQVAGVAVGKSGRHWLNSAVQYDFYYLKGILEEIAQEFGLKFDYRVPEKRPLLHPGRSADIYLHKECVGFLGELHPAQEKEWALEKAVLFELDLGALFKHMRPVVRAQSIPRFPAINRDLAVVVSLETSAAAVMTRIRKLGGELLQNVEIFDVYTGKSIPEGRKSLAFSLRYQSLERTLTDEEVNALNSRILEGIQQEFDAEWRK
ncbi:phenylalanyl-tRNA synthetase, beta subunit [Desulfosporosinus acidiphilus SJ4]|uniref:Phenylalanine--tRNA ligase beta subunit n=1 Tax=Desulfosporosinus acidiphilus (strain DSM 22704 / JCM 16185 / SJ4) TaxID=646529 RepID=I4D0B4_DESAJ|nr:phenylalanine--tRNA ligase subunit beta [Desulfosporosinus acidiphilus]AFM39238.1 phenylalanyl-tRNA synthetase, beta subunit [Desulfosporosinus acidiphilus SJ4]